MTDQEQTPPEGFNLDAEKERESDAATEGITSRELDPVDEVGDPDEDSGEDDGNAPDDNEIDDPDDDGVQDDV
jgi:hypothetical protein